MKHEPLIVERTYNAPSDLVWKAITDKDAMKQWYFNLPDFKADVGFEFQFKAGKDPARLYTHLCQVTEVVGGKKLSYSWRYDGYPGNSIVTFELFPEGDKTTIRLTHSGLENFEESHNPDLYPENFAEGWKQIIGRSLREFVESQTLVNT